MICLLTGDRNVGKTTLVKRVLARVREQGVSATGFYTDGGPETRDLVPVGPGQPIPFAAQSRNFPGELSIGRYSINPAAIEVGIAACRADGEVLVVDEIGRLERRGEGFADLLASIDPDPYRGVLLSVRKGVADFVEAQLPATASTRRFEITRTNRDALPDQVTECLLDGD